MEFLTEKSKKELLNILEKYIEENKKLENINKEKHRFSKWQLIEVINGIREGLKPEYILFYAKSMYPFAIMNIMREGFKEGLDIDEMKIFALPKLDIYLARIIKNFFVYNKDIENIKEKIFLLTNINFNMAQIEEIKKGIENNLTLGQLKIMAKPEFDEDQMKEIRLGFEKGLSIAQVKIYATHKHRFSHKMRILRKGLIQLTDKFLKEGFTPDKAEKKSIECIKPFSDPTKYTYIQLEEAIKGILNGLDNIQIKYLLSLNIDEIKLSKIRESLELGLTSNQISYFVNFNRYQIDAIINGIKEIKNELEKYKIKKTKALDTAFKYISLYIKKDFSEFQMEAVTNALIQIIRERKNIKDKDIISNEEIKLLINKNYSPKFIQVLKDFIIIGFQPEDIKKIFKIYNIKDSSEKILKARNEIIYLIEKGKIDKKKNVMFFIQNYGNKNFSNDQILQIAEGIKENLGKEYINIYAKNNLSSSQMGVLRTLIKKYKKTGLNYKQIKIFQLFNFNNSYLDIIKHVNLIKIKNKIYLVFTQNFDNSVINNVKKQIGRFHPVDKILISANPYSTYIIENEKETCIDKPLREFLEEEKKKLQNNKKSQNFILKALQEFFLKQ